MIYIGHLLNRIKHEIENKQTKNNNIDKITQLNIKKQKVGGKGKKF